MFNPTSTFSSLLKSPIIFLIGSGTLRTRVGMANIWSPSANWGCSSKSITSMRYCPCRCSSQYFFKLLRAVTDFGVFPATYSLSSHFLSCSSIILIYYRFFSRLPHLPLYGLNARDYFLKIVFLILLPYKPC